MRAPPPELSILADSDRPRSIRSLSERSNGNYRAFVRAAHALEEQGAIQLHAQGRELQATANSSRLTGLANDLLGRRAHRGLADVFRSDRPETLWVLHQARRVDLSAEVTGKTPGAVRYMIRSLQSAGLLVKESTGYRLHPQHRSLAEMLSELDRLRAEQRVKEVAPRARLVWHLGPEMLVQAEDVPHGAQLAGLDAFSRYGIDIQTRGPPLHYVGHRTLTAADVLLQALVAEGYETPGLPDVKSYGQRAGPEFGYACLLWEKEKPRDIWAKADLYDQYHGATDVVEYVHEKSDEWSGFIPWSEHERLRKLYGIQS